MHGGKKQKPKEKNLFFIFIFFLGDNSIVEGDVDILRLQITSTSKLGTTLSSHRLVDIVIADGPWWARETIDSLKLRVLFLSSSFYLVELHQGSLI